MEQGELIDKLVGTMYDKAMKSDFAFNRFAVPWGPKNSDSFYHKKSDFDNTIVRFAKECGIMALNKNFYQFNGKIYEKVSKEAVALAYDQLMMKLGIATDYATSVKVRTDKFLNIILFYNQLHIRNDVIAFSNRVVDLRYNKGTDFVGTYRHGPERHVVDYHDYPYIPDAKCPKFMEFLDRVLPDKRQRDILQMFLGLGLVQTSDAFDKTIGGPRGTVELCLVLLGSGANGKSVLFNIMCALFGKHHITSVDYETMTAEGDEGMRGRATIRSALFNWSSDSDSKKFCQKNTHIFKRIISGEKFQYRLLGQDIMESHSCPYLIFSLNSLPNNISDSSRGLLRRLQFVNFDVTIPRYQQNPNLAYEIIQTDLPGIFNWVMRGAQEIRRRKFRFPPSDASLKTKVKTLLPTNPVAAWMLAYGIRGEQLAPTEIGCCLSTDLLYKCFKTFCEYNDEEVNMTVNKFSRVLGSLNFERRRKNDGSYFNTYGVTEDKLRSPMSIALIRDEIDETEKFEKDGMSFIKND